MLKTCKKALVRDYENALSGLDNKVFYFAKKSKKKIEKFLCVILSGKFRHALNACWCSARVGHAPNACWC
jgi:hypothetical protein